MPLSLFCLTVAHTSCCYAVLWHDSRNCVRLAFADCHASLTLISSLAIPGEEGHQLFRAKLAFPRAVQEEKKGRDLGIFLQTSPPACQRFALPAKDDSPDSVLTPHYVRQSRSSIGEREREKDSTDLNKLRLQPNASWEHGSWIMTFCYIYLGNIFNCMF